MENGFALEPIKIQLLAQTQELRDYNTFTAQFGLSLSEAQIQVLAEHRFNALKNTGRVEFGGGILKKLIYAFSDSPYIFKENYLETLLELQDAFYYYKNESMDRISDDELIDFMKTVFDGKAQGSLAFLSGTSLEDLCRYARNGGNRFDANDQVDRN